MAAYFFRTHSLAQSFGVMLALFACLPSNARGGFDPPLVTLHSDKATYIVGEAATLRATFSTAPDNPRYAFDLVSSFDGNPLEVQRLTDFDQLARTAPLLAGSHVWQVQVVIQDAKYAAALKSSIVHFQGEITRLDNAIAVETDPARLASLQNQRGRQAALKAAAESELVAIRTPLFAPLSLGFTAQ